MKIRILILDDEESIRFSLGQVLEHHGYVVQDHGDPFDALQALQDFRPHLVISDYALPKMDGLEFMELVLKRAPQTLVIFMTAYGTEDLAVEAMKRGAYDYFKKPFDNDAVLVSVSKAREKIDLVEENRRLRRKAAHAPKDSKTFVGQSPQVQEVFRLVERISGTDVTVLIQGESGTGKELVAQAIHRGSDRADEPLVKLNCGAIPANLVESELFGHEQGAFTGAQKARKGRFEQADRGTLFLDEIGDMPLEAQTKLLRVLQEGEVERLGGTQVIPVDVRIVAATNQDLQELVREGTFREDLFYRLNVVHLALPPLRNREGDLEALVDHFLQVYGDRFGSGGLRAKPEELDRLRAHRWPGNVRELENVVARAVLQGSFDGLPVEVEAYSRQQRQEESLEGAPPGAAPPETPVGVAGSPLGEPSDLEARVVGWLQGGVSFQDAKKELIEDFERGFLTRLLDQADGNVSEAARRAGMYRKNLWEKMQKLGISEPRAEDEEGGAKV